MFFCEKRSKLWQFFFFYSISLKILNERKIRTFIRPFFYKKMIFSQPIYHFTNFWLHILGYKWFQMMIYYLYLHFIFYLKIDYLLSFYEERVWLYNLAIIINIRKTTCSSKKTCFAFKNWTITCKFQKNY